MAVKILAISLPKRPCNGGFTSETAVRRFHGGFRSETATWIQKWLKKSVGASRKFYV
jgi:hypothetical protein